MRLIVEVMEVSSNFLYLSLEVDNINIGQCVLEA